MWWKRHGESVYPIAGPREGVCILLAAAEKPLVVQHLLDLVCVALGAGVQEGGRCLVVPERRVPESGMLVALQVDNKALHYIGDQCICNTDNPLLEEVAAIACNLGVGDVTERRHVAAPALASRIVHVAHLPKLLNLLLGEEEEVLKTFVAVAVFDREGGPVHSYGGGMRPSPQIVILPPVPAVHRRLEPIAGHVDGAAIENTAVELGACLGLIDLLDVPAANQSLSQEGMQGDA